MANLVNRPLRRIARLQWLARMVSAVTITCLGPPAHAQDDTQERCEETLAASRDAWHRGQLVQARLEFAGCATAHCEPAVRTQCVEERAAVAAEIPTLRITARGERGTRTTAVRVFVNGVRVAEHLRTGVFELDPGEYLVRFERDGSLPIRRVIRLERRQDYPVLADFSAEATPRQTSERATTDDVLADAADANAPSGLRPFAYLAGGVGGAGLLSWAALGLSSSRQLEELERSCGRGCGGEELDALRAKLRAADISLGVGIAGVATGVTLFFLSRPKPEPQRPGSVAWSFSLEPDKSGGYGRVRGKF